MGQFLLGGRGGEVSLAFAHALQAAQIDQDIDQGVWVGDGRPAAQLGTFDAEFQRLAVNSSVDRALVVNGVVLGAVAIQLVADAGAWKCLTWLIVNHPRQFLRLLNPILHLA